MKKYSKKKLKKLLDKCCYICKESNLDLLDAHRIVPGSEKGRYTEHNMVILCCKCHRLVHAGTIKIDKKYYSTAGKWVLHYWLDGVEKWE